jgi:hypothetical protein
VEAFLGWLTEQGIDPDAQPVYRRCVEWIIHCAGRADFDEAGLEEALRLAAADESAARQVDNIRAAGAAWLRWREAGVKAPRHRPEASWIERLRAQLLTRSEVRAAYLVEVFSGREEPRHVVWVELAEATAPAQLLAEIGARLPTCHLDDRILSLRAGDGGPLDELVRAHGELLYQRAATARVRTPSIEQHERTEGAINKRYTLDLMTDIDGSIPTADSLRAVEKRIATWKQSRAAKANRVLLGFIVPRRLHAQVSREISAAIAGWGALFDDGKIKAVVAFYDENGDPVA